MSLTDYKPAKIKALPNEMNESDKKVELKELSAAINEEFSPACLRYLSAEKDHSLVLKQTSRVKWTVEGDENSAFFHGIIR